MGDVKLSDYCNILAIALKWRKLSQGGYKLFRGKDVPSVGLSRMKEIKVCFLIILFAAPGPSPKGMGAIYRLRLGLKLPENISFST